MAFKADTGYIKFLQSGLVTYFGRNASQTLPQQSAILLPLTIFKQKKITSHPRSKKPLRVIVQVRSALSTECHESAALEPLIVSLAPYSTVEEIVSRILLAIAGQLCEHAEFQQQFFASLMKVQRKSKKKHGSKGGEESNQLKNGIIYAHTQIVQTQQSRRSEDKFIFAATLQEQIAKLLCVYSLTLDGNNTSPIIVSPKNAKHIPKIYDLMRLDVFMNPLSKSFCQDIQSLISSTDQESCPAQQNCLSNKSSDGNKKPSSPSQAAIVTNLSQNNSNSCQKKLIISSEFQSMKNNNKFEESNIVQNTGHWNNNNNTNEDTARFQNQIQIILDSNENNRLFSGRQTKKNNEMIKHLNSVSLDPNQQTQVIQTENEATLLDQTATKIEDEIQKQKKLPQTHSTSLRQKQQYILPQETRSTDISSHFQESESYSPLIHPPLKKKRKLSNNTLPKEDEQKSLDSSYSNFVSGLLASQQQLETTPISSKILAQSGSEFLGSDSEGIMTSLNNLEIQSTQPQLSNLPSNQIFQDNKNKDKYIHRLKQTKKQLKNEILSKHNFRLINDSNVLKHPKKTNKSNSMNMGMANDLSIPIRRQIYERQQLWRILDESMQKNIGNTQKSSVLQRINSKKEEFENLCQILLVYSRLGNYTSRRHETVIQDITAQMRTKFIISKQDILSLMTDLEHLFPSWIHTKMSEYGKLLQFSHHFSFRHVRNLFKEL